jgi:hypothetical protein
MSKLLLFFNINFLKYLFSKKSYSDISWFTVIKCRLDNHPCGVVWYNPNGLEPDMHCKNCGDDLG